jgi:hypothetical protein
MSPDPIAFKANDLNLYRYTFNSPTNHRDPTGHTTLSEYAYTTFGVAVTATAVALIGVDVFLWFTCAFFPRQKEAIEFLRTLKKARDSLLVYAIELVIASRVGDAAVFDFSCLEVRRAVLGILRTIENGKR